MWDERTCKVRESERLAGSSWSCSVTVSGAKRLCRTMVRRTTGVM